MIELHRLERRGSIAIFRAQRPIAIAEGIQIIKKLIVDAQKDGITKLVINLLAMQDLKPPTLATRHFLAREWALASAGNLHLAIVAREEFLDPQKLGAIVAKNFGMTMEGFTSEADAIAWLENNG